MDRPTASVCVAHDHSVIAFIGDGCCYRHQLASLAGDGTSHRPTPATGVSSVGEGDAAAGGRGVRREELGVPDVHKAGLALVGALKPRIGEGVHIDLVTGEHRILRDHQHGHAAAVALLTAGQRFQITAGGGFELNGRLIILFFFFFYLID